MKNTSKAAPLFSRGGLGVLAILVSLRTLSMLVAHAMLFRRAPLGILVGILVLDTLVFTAHFSQSRSPFHYSYPTHLSKYNQSRVRVRADPA